MSTVVDLSTLKREDVKVVDDSLDTALAQTIADYEARAGKKLQPAHIERLLINTSAYRESLALQKVNEAYRQQHPRFATGLMLDLCGDDVDTPRLAAQPARCTLRFTAVLTGSTTVTIPVGTRIGAGAVFFATAQAVTLKANQLSADTLAICETTGTAGNGWSIGQINTPAQTLHASIEVKVSNITVPTGGVDDEADEPYRERIFLAYESFSSAGTPAAHQYFIRAVSQAICDVDIDHDIDASGNPIGGTVVATVLTTTGLPSAELLAQIETDMSDEKRRILCDTFTARAAVKKNYSITAQLDLLAGANEDDVMLAAREALNAQYLQPRAYKMGRDIVPLDIQTALKVAGVNNVRLTSPALTVVKDNEWAYCTSVTLTAAEVRQDG